MKENLIKSSGHIASIILGLFFVIYSNMAIATIMKVFAILLVIIGGFLMIKYLTSSVKPHQMNLIGGGILAAAGIMLIIFSASIANTVLPIMIGTVILLSGIYRLWLALSFKRLGANVWMIPMISAVIAIVISFVIIFNTGATSSFISIILGVYLLISGVSGVAEVYTANKYKK